MGLAVGGDGQGRPLGGVFMSGQSRAESAVAGRVLALSCGHPGTGLVVGLAFRGRGLPLAGDGVCRGIGHG